MSLIPSTTGTPSSHDIPRQVWLLGFMMFLINLSYLMVFSYTGVYLKTILGVSTCFLGYIEGFAEALSLMMKLFSGMLSDFTQRRKPIMVLGLAINMSSRIVLGFFATFGPVFTARLMERFGNGVYGTPRDTIVADVTPPKRIGEAYGIKRALAQAGAFVGCIVGMFAMQWTGENYQQVFRLAAIPVVLAFLILIFFIKEPRKSSHSAISSEIPLPAPKNRPKITLANLPLLGQTFWRLMAVTAIFMLSRFSETFLMVHAKESFNLAPTYISMVMLVFNGAWCLSSYPIGLLGDRLNRYWLLAIGIVFLIMANLVLGSAQSLNVMLIGVAFWGMQYSVTLNIFLSLISEIVPEYLRGTALGCYYTICALSAFLGDAVFGHLAHSFGFSSGFLWSGVMGSVSLLCLLVTMGYKKIMYPLNDKEFDTLLI